ncbi:peptide ABC transporter substrate-binding protein [Candidatus Gracilibacteria bacterium]|nr:peptide ABC transporter substrate-binding protein [Candidatus Gracilibacteria bacterium]
MNVFRKIIEVFRTYTYADKIVSVLALAVFLLMLTKMILFPYGLFGFGQSSIYTEGLVSKNGIQSINPLFVDYNEADREVSRLVFSGLMKYDPSKKAVVDDMAHLTISEDKKNYVFTLRDGLRWHDDQPVTIDDVYFTFHELILNPAFPNDILRTNFSGVKVTKVDDKNIKFTLEKPNAFFVSNFLTGILPKHILKDVNPADILQSDFNKKPIGSGAYEVKEAIESFQDGRSQITLTRNDTFYGEKSEIEQMRFIVYPTTDDLLDHIDAVNGVVKVSGNNIMDFLNNDRFKLVPYELPQYSALFMNMESKILKNSDVRSALARSLDKVTYIGDSLDKISINTPILELKQKDWGYKYDTALANANLKTAGYTYMADDKDHVGIRYDKEENALELKMVVRLYDEGTYQFAETKKLVTFLSDSWKKIGIKAQVQFLPVEAFNERVSKRDYDILLVGQNLGYNSDTYSFWHSTQAGPLGQNLSSYKSFKVDSFIEDIRSTFDPIQRTAKLKELAKALNDDVPAIFLYRPIYYYASDTKLTGLSMDGAVFPSDRFANISIWKFQK